MTSKALLLLALVCALRAQCGHILLCTHLGCYNSCYDINEVEVIIATTCKTLMFKTRKALRCSWGHLFILHERIQRKSYVKA
ncbi:hypothetical protein BJV78DRAFT_301609 [Lactifluus subvellereus]|nr:hypothetical protein BJV78DRAFT_301609 [Lactifluus subvellereus]